MRILLDNIIYALQKAGGISTYWGEISKRLIRDDQDVCFIEGPTDNIVRASFSINPSNILGDGSFPQIVNRFLPLNLKNQKNRFLFHSSYNRITTNKQAAQVVTIHDFVHEIFYKGLRQKLHSYQKNKAINLAQKIICVSANTKLDLMKLHPQIAEEKIEVIYNGVSDDFFPIINSVSKDLSAKPYLLFIGSREHYKNFNFCVDLLRSVNGFDLKIVGSPLKESETKYLEKNILGRWSIQSKIDNATLNGIYNDAFALLYPSSYEGFGIPILEAMKAGLPFIALNKSSIPEVAGEAGILLNELSIDNFKKALELISLNRESIVEKGYKQAQKFSWERCYQETLKVYKELYN